MSMFSRTILVAGTSAAGVCAGMVGLAWMDPAMSAGLGSFAMKTVGLVSAGFAVTALTMGVQFKALGSLIASVLKNDKMEDEHLGRSGELGALARAIMKFRDGDEGSEQPRWALNTCPNSVMLTDNNNLIVFMNNSAVRLFRDHANDFRTVIPNFDPDQIKGKNMGMFHRNANHQERMVSAMTSNHVSRIRVGKQVFDLSISPILNLERKRTGTMLEWRVMTAEASAQSEVKDMAAAVATGDFSRRVTLDGKTGFTLDIATAMNEIGATVDRATTELAEALGALAEGDLTKSIKTEYGGRLGQLKDAFNETVAGLSETVQALQITAVDVGTAARRDQYRRRRPVPPHRGAGLLAGADGSHHRGARSLCEGLRRSRPAKRSIQPQRGHGGRRRRRRDRQPGRRGDGTYRAGLAEDLGYHLGDRRHRLPDQPAGAQCGRGSGPRRRRRQGLRRRRVGSPHTRAALSEAAKDITGLINSSTAEVAHGVKLVRSAGEALGKIVGASRQVAATVSDISSAAGEQANGIDEMSQAVAHMDEMTQQNAALAEESAASAASLSGQIQQLNDIVATFRTRRVRQ